MIFWCEKMYRDDIYQTSRLRIMKSFIVSSHQTPSDVERFSNCSALSRKVLRVHKTTHKRDYDFTRFWGLENWERKQAASGARGSAWSQLWCVLEPHNFIIMRFPSRSKTLLLINSLFFNMCLSLRCDFFRGFMKFHTQKYFNIFSVTRTFFRKGWCVRHVNLNDRENMDT